MQRISSGGSSDDAAAPAVEPDHLEVEPLSEGPVYNSAAGRRKSVFTESYDPEEDEDDVKPVRISACISDKYTL